MSQQQQCLVFFQQPVVLHGTLVSGVNPPLSPSPLLRLWLDRNALKSLPQELENCTNLQELYLDQNPELRDVPPSLTLLPSLRKLYLGESR